MGGKEKAAYDCRKCDSSFHELFDLIEHENVHSGETPFMCLTCRETFCRLHQYVKHLKIGRRQQNKVKDSTCSSVADKHLHTLKPYTNNVNEISMKPRMVLIEDKKKVQTFKKRKTNLKGLPCNLSKIQSNTLTQMKTHKKDMLTLRCPKCKKIFSTSDDMIHHACIILCSCLEIFTNSEAYKLHVGTKPFTCCKCLMKFNTLANLIRHNRTHTNQKPYVCNDCGRGFSQSAHLRNHATLHLSKCAVKCNDCDFSCKTLNGLLKHKKKHTGLFNNIKTYTDGRKTSTNPHNCPVCNKEFLFKRNMGMHLRVHNTTVLLCAQCGKTFSTQAKLSSHFKACHREPSTCKTCGKIFASAVLLRAHIKIHARNKLYSCQLCQKSFCVKNYLTQHMKTHKNKKEFSCSRCGKLFKAFASLKYHSNSCTSVKMKF